MAQQGYLIAKNKQKINKETNILDLRRKSRSDKIKEKKHTLAYVTLSLLLLILVTNIIIF